MGLDLMLVVSQRTTGCKIQDSIWVRYDSQTEINSIIIMMTKICVFLKAPVAERENGRKWEA